MWADQYDVVTRWVGSGAPELGDAVLVAKIADAEEVVRAELPDIDARLTAGTVTIGRLRMVIAGMVERAFRNPQGLRSFGETTGATSVQSTYGGETPGALWLTNDERFLLGYGPKLLKRAFTIDTTPAAAAVLPATPPDLDWT